MGAPGGAVPFLTAVIAYRIQVALTLHCLSDSVRCAGSLLRIGGYFFITQAHSIIVDHAIVFLARHGLSSAEDTKAWLLQWLVPRSTKEIGFEIFKLLLMTSDGRVELLRIRILSLCDAFWPTALSGLCFRSKN